MYTLSKQSHSLQLVSQNKMADMNSASSRVLQDIKSTESYWGLWFGPTLISFFVLEQTPDWSRNRKESKPSQSEFFPSILFLLVGENTCSSPCSLPLGLKSWGFKFKAPLFISYSTGEAAWRGWSGSTDLPRNLTTDDIKLTPVSLNFRLCYWQLDFVLKHQLREATSEFPFGLY